MGKKKRQPTSEDMAKFTEAQRLDQMGNVPAAMATYEALARQFPDQADLQFAVGYAALRLSDLKTAVSRFDRALAIDPRKAHVYAMKALALSAMSRITDGLAAADRALALRAEDPTALFVKAELLRLDARSEEAVALLEPRIERLSGSPEVVDAFAQAAMNVGRSDDALEAVRRALETQGVGGDGRSRLLFRLGAILDKRAEFDEAFGAFVEANQLKRVHFDPEQERRGVEGRLKAWTTDRVATLPRAREASELPVFVVGMPRSGTTLVEQIIASHPLAYGGGEREIVPRCGREVFRDMPRGKSELECLDGLTQGTVDRMAKRELKEMKRLGKGAARFTDKMMTNFRHLGLIQLLFPGACVVYCRRDPLDTCLSCFFHDFPGTNSQAYSYSLEHVAFFLRLSERFMAHWREVLSLPILEVSYEEVVEDQEAQTRRILKFLGLEWDDACMSFHETKRDVVTLSAEQVRRPMYRSSVRRHENYTAHLGPLREALGVE